MITNIWPNMTWQGQAARNLTEQPVSWGTTTTLPSLSGRKALSRYWKSFLVAELCRTCPISSCTAFQPSSSDAICTTMMLDWVVLLYREHRGEAEQSNEIEWVLLSLLGLLRIQVPSGESSSLWYQPVLFPFPCPQLLARFFTNPFNIYLHWHTLEVFQCKWKSYFHITPVLFFSNYWRSRELWESPQSNCKAM